MTPPTQLDTRAAPTAVATEPHIALRAGRDPVLDLLRSVALARVVLWHTFAATWMMGIAAMPVMFFVAGTLLPANRGLKAHIVVVRRRARRLLLPLWAYSATVALALTITGHRVTSSGQLVGLMSWLVPLSDPVSSAWHAGWLSNHLWYLRAYLWLLLLAPVLVWLARRVRMALALSAAAIVVLELAPGAHLAVIGSGHGRVIIGDIVAYGLFAVLGIAYKQCGLERRRMRAPYLLVLAALAAAGTWVFAVTRGLPAGGINASYPAIVLCGLAWLSGLGACQRPLRRFADHPRVSETVTRISSRALTIYLWHPAAIVIARVLIKGSGPVWAGGLMAAVVTLTAVPVVVLGWIEDVAARRTLQRDRSGGSAQVSALVSSVIFVTLAAMVLTVSVPRLLTPDAAVNGVSATPLVPPSYRDALSDNAFAGDAPPAQTAAGAPPGVDVTGAAPVGPGETPATSASVSPGTKPPMEERPRVANGPDVPPAAADFTGRGPQLQAALDTWLAARPTINAVAVSVVFDGREWSGESVNNPTGTGVATYAVASGGPAPFRLADEYAIASITKTFTAALVLREVEAGTIALDEPVLDLPGLEGLNTQRRITPRQLLQHASGLVNYTAADGYSVRAFSPLEAVAMSMRTAPLAAPGTEVSYANTNYLYLGLLLEHVTHRPYRDLARDLITSAGLAHTTVDVPDHPGWVGFSSGSISSSVGDLARWGTVLFLPGHVLSAASVDLLTTIRDHNMAMGTWPICPCWTDKVTGARNYTAIGHQAEMGAVNYYPRLKVSVAARIDPPSADAGAHSATLGMALGDVFQHPDAASAAVSSQRGP